jgi:hypothetical protein
MKGAVRAGGKRLRIQRTYRANINGRKSQKLKGLTEMVLKKKKKEEVADRKDKTK